ncbi:MAG: gliding motility-associated C-terminal domain-containing protein [Saprospiraceae bacterium]|nr:gliding motility-associated C-terminal domain-containing protein [Saprospiraceae bacterium]
MRQFLSLFLWMAAGTLSAQQFIQEFRTQRNDAASAVRQVEGREYLMLNQRFGLAGPDSAGLNLTKMGKNGRQRWSRDYDFGFPLAGGDLARWIQQGDYLVSAISAVDTVQDKIVARFNPTGSLAWARRLGSDNGIQTLNAGHTKILPVTDEELIVAAGASSFASDAGANDLLLAKLNADGGLIWSRNFCFSCLGNYDAQLGDLLQTSDGGYLLSGALRFSDMTGTREEALLIKTDTAGQIVWARSFAAASAEYLLALRAWSLAEPKDGRYVWTGTITDGDNTVNDGLFVSMADTGTVQFSTRWNLAGGITQIFNYDLVSRDTGSVVIAGSSLDTDAPPDMARELNFLAAVSIDSMQTLWAKNYFEEKAGTHLTPYHALTGTTDGGYAYFISIDSQMVNSNAVLVKTNADGETNCEQDLILTKDSLALVVTEWTIQVDNLSAIDTIELEDQMVFNDINPTMEGLELTGGGAFCEPLAVLLDATVQEAETYAWSNGANTPTITATKEGMYTVLVSSGTLCFSLPDTTSVTIIPPPMGNVTVNPDTLCESNQVLLIANGVGVATYTWSNGSSASAIVVTTPGTYTVTMTNPCGSITATGQVTRVGCDCDLIFPNAFTPDNDQTNDAFLPTEPCSLVKDFKLFVYNRWGENMFSSTTQTDGWNGEFNGLPAPSDVYAWYATYTSPEGETITVKGDVTLLR